MSQPRWHDSWKQMATDQLVAALVSARCRALNEHEVRTLVERALEETRGVVPATEIAR